MKNLPNKKTWEEEFDGFKLEEYGKWKIGRVEAKNFIRQKLAAKEQELELKFMERLAEAEVRNFKAGKEEVVEKAIKKSVEVDYGGFVKAVLVSDLQTLKQSL